MLGLQAPTITTKWPSFSRASRHSLPKVKGSKENRNGPGSTQGQLYLKNVIQTAAAKLPDLVLPDHHGTYEFPRPGTIEETAYGYLEPTDEGGYAQYDGKANRDKAIAKVHIDRDMSLLPDPSKRQITDGFSTSGFEYQLRHEDPGGLAHWLFWAAFDKGRGYMKALDDFDQNDKIWYVVGGGSWWLMENLPLVGTQVSLRIHVLERDKVFKSPTFRAEFAGGFMWKPERVFAIIDAITYRQIDTESDGRRPAFRDGTPKPKRTETH